MVFLTLFSILLPGAYLAVPSASPVDAKPGGPLVHGAKASDPKSAPQRT